MSIKPARIVFPGFWFGKSDLKQAEELARSGVGGFCLYNAKAQQAQDFIKRMQDVSPYDVRSLSVFKSGFPRPAENPLKNADQKDALSE